MECSSHAGRWKWKPKHAAAVFHAFGSSQRGQLRLLGVDATQASARFPGEVGPRYRTRESGPNPRHPEGPKGADPAQSCDRRHLMRYSFKKTWRNLEAVQPRKCKNRCQRPTQCVPNKQPPQLLSEPAVWSYQWDSRTEMSAQQQCLGETHSQPVRRS